MVALSRLAIIIAAALLFSPCTGEEENWDKFRVVSEKITVYERPSSTSAVVGEIPFGSRIKVSDRGLNNAITRGWLRVKSDDISGFMEKRGIAEEKIYREISSLFEGTEKSPALATAETGRRVSLLLKPEKDAVVIEHLRDPAKVDLLERMVVAEGDKGRERRQLWYKARLSSGRSGFLLKRQVRLTPPPELNVYTQVRTPVSWQSLNENVDPESGRSGWDYIVTYESVGQDIDTDFTRFELYTFDPRTRQYGTALAKSGLYGILPVKIIDSNGGGKVIEIRHHPRGDKGKVGVMRYSYPSPIKLIGESVEDAGKEGQ